MTRQQKAAWEECEKRSARAYRLPSVAELAAIRPGDQVLLRWNGYPNLPGYCDGALATVQRITRSGRFQGVLPGYDVQDRRYCSSGTQTADNCVE
jgi:hypothetical protein